MTLRPTVLRLMANVTASDLLALPMKAAVVSRPPLDIQRLRVLAGINKKSPPSCITDWRSKAGFDYRSRLAVELDTEGAPQGPRARGWVRPGGIRTTSWPWLPSTGWYCARLSRTVTPPVR
jgi:hypothetical protein